MNKRQVSFSTLFRLIRQRGPLAILGLVFPLVALFILFPLVTLIGLIGQQPFEHYDQQKVAQQGIELPARVTFVSVLYNVSVNGQHPAVVSYSYQHNGTTVNDKFETMEIGKIANWKPGDDIRVKALNGQSIIVGLQAFSFPVFIFYVLPGVFLVIGSIFFFIGTLPAIRAYNLCKTGTVHNATIVSIEPLRRGVEVNYYYTGIHQDRIFGKSATDFSIISEKRPDDTVKIFVSDTDETNSCLVPKLDAFKYNWDI